MFGLGVECEEGGEGGAEGILNIQGHDFLATHLGAVAEVVADHLY